MTIFPVGVDSFTNPTPSDNLNTPAVLHSSQHANLNDAVEAIETDVLQRGTFLVNFGIVPTYSKRFVVPFPAMVFGKTVEVYQIFRSTTDEDEMDSIQLRAYSQTGSFSVYADAFPGPVVGEYLIGYRYF